MAIWAPLETMYQAQPINTDPTYYTCFCYVVGGATSPLLANLFLHYAFDQWMVREFPNVPFERYADDAVCHCKSQSQAQQLKQNMEARMKEVGLELHPKKTKVVYCKDDDRRGNYSEVSFDFLDYTFHSRRSKNRWGKHLINFTPAISNKAAKALRHKSRDWNWPSRSDKQLEDIARSFKVGSTIMDVTTSQRYTRPFNA
jgi:RNA-directed DNA polymerase